MKKLSNQMHYAYPVLLLITSAIGIFTVVNNLTAGLYGIGKDSIGLPIGAMFIICITLLAMHLLQVFSSKKAKVHFPGKILLTALSLIAAILSSAILAGCITYWFIPDHIIIAISYSFTALAFGAFQIQLLKTAK
ncbi:hypothetical protein ACIOYV_24215 [Pseudomonas sp. NPDC087342]|uniref:hypothetical protein n=1 Tax=Pseudomonas sp. NPDC087342 TaxID=3364437 RepID=UPI00382DFD8A